MSDQTDQEVEPQRFAAFLATHNRGRTEGELSRLLGQLVRAVDDTGRGGTLQFALSIKPEPKVEGAMIVTDKVTLKAPEHERAASIFFADARYHLVRQDPSQLSFEQAFEEASSE